MSTDRTLLLASASPRRRDILTALGWRVVVSPVDVDERELDGEIAALYLARIVDAKLAAAQEIELFGDVSALIVADTIVTCDGAILHKPTDALDNARMLRTLADRAHLVTTRFAILTPDARTHAESVSTRVFFRALDEQEIETYARSGEGLDKAGGYGMQGRAGAFIARIEGSYGAVIGLPQSEVTLALRALLA